ncbi:MAG: serine hydrolase [Planctomycetota bacterium]
MSARSASRSRGGAAPRIGAWFAAIAACAAQDAPPAREPVPVAARPEFALEVDAFCRPLIEAEVAIGLVVGIVDGDATLVRGYGTVAAGGPKQPDADTVYEIGSISKVFTGLLLALAVEDGRVALADPVQKHLPPQVRMPRTDAAEVLLWHLTTHTSGLPRLPSGTSPDPDDPYAHFDRDRLFAAVAESPLQNEPGSTYEYSNLAVGLLGQLLVDTAGAVSFDALLQERITGPLGLGDTSVHLGDAQRERLAPPYGIDGDPAHNWDLAAFAGAGGIRSTMRDMLTFARAQLHPDRTPLAAAIRRSHQKLHDGVDGMAVACGWHFARDGSTLWHNGQTGGYHSYLAVSPAAGRAVCLLTNMSRGEVDVVGERLLQRLFGMPAEPLAIERPVEVEREALERCVGTYQLQPNVRMRVTLRERGLYAQLTGQDAFRLYPRSTTEFFYRVTAASVTFEVEGDEVKALVLHQGGRDIRAPRR